MSVEGLLNVTRKEFSDFITSRRFFVIMVLFLIVSAIGVYNGIESYNQQLESYTETIEMLDSQDSGLAVNGWMSEKPSIMLVFNSMSGYISVLGVVLAIAIGFDMISREKETRSLKTLLSHPLFRDEIINGKALAGVLALVLAMGIAFMVSVAMLLLFSIVPTLNEMGQIIIFGAVSVIFLLSFFAVALMMSTVSKDSGNALVYSLVIFFFLSSFLPLVSWVVADMVVGEAPEPPSSGSNVVRTLSVNGVSEKTIANPASMSEEERVAYEEEAKRYWDKRAFLSSTFNLFSPQMNFMKVSMAVTNPRIAMTMDNNPYSYSQGPPEDIPGLAEIIETIWANILGLFVFPMVFFAIAYVQFMRMDIR